MGVEWGTMEVLRTILEVHWGGGGWRGRKDVARRGDRMGGRGVRKFERGEGKKGVGKKGRVVGSGAGKGEGWARARGWGSSWGVG